jgi:DNA/RNA-binding domain of Phe-tRNA-synthetase-like protein
LELYMLSISATHEWHAAHTGAIIGLLELSGIEKIHISSELDQRKREIETRLRERYNGFTRHDFLLLPVMSDYERYYKRFNKTYHVQLQVESIVLKGKDLPTLIPLVDSNFMAEVETFVLTAGHDVGKLHGPVLIDVSREGEHITQMNGTFKAIREGDMIMRDANGISCSVIYGQDNRSPISPETSCVLYVAYAPTGISSETVDTQLRKIEDNIRLFSPNAFVEYRQLLYA